MHSCAAKCNPPHLCSIRQRLESPNSLQFQAIIPRTFIKNMEIFVRYLIPVCSSDWLFAELSYIQFEMYGFWNWQSFACFTDRLHWSELLKTCFLSLSDFWTPAIERHSPRLSRFQLTTRDKISKRLLWNHLAKLLNRALMHWMKLTQSGKWTYRIVRFIESGSVVRKHKKEPWLGLRYQLTCPSFWVFFTREENTHECNSNLEDSFFHSTHHYLICVKYWNRWLCIYSWKNDLKSKLLFE